VSRGRRHRGCLFNPGVRRLALVLVLSSLVLGGCGSRVESTQGPTAPGPSLGALPTSPAGGADDTPTALPEKLIQIARSFRGNPWPLGVLTATALLIALVLGAYTLFVAYREPPTPNR
jgi:hypothetical protein